ncbi:MAG: ABC transporter substrate-binding protein [Acidobacteria bacterium]|nr:ABC transporter substrate-binding protein [Acidobacteriota bacterium]
MLTRLARIKLAFLVLLMVMAGVLAAPAHMQGKDELTEQEKRGRQIYLKGTAASEIMALLGDDELEVPASSFTCSNCHGLRGEGSKEGGLQPPPIDWQTLTKPHASALTGRERRAYNEATLARAISAGLDPDAVRMHPGMPRYVMTRDQMADLIAYLKRLDKDASVEIGMTDESIKVGAALPLTGPLAPVGEDIKATLNASFAQVNAQGGIYGRRFQLVTEDSRGEAAATLEATRRLIEQDGVFALVGSFEPGDSSAVNRLIKTQEIPLVGPVTLSPRHELPPNPYVFYLLPTFADQARSLVDFVSTKSKSKQTRLAVVYAGNDFNLDALGGLKTQVKLYPMEVVSEQSYNAGHFEAAKIVQRLAAQKPDYIFFFGTGDDAEALATEMEGAGLKIPLLSSVVMLGRHAFNLPADLAAQTFLSFPSELPVQENFAEFVGVMQKANVTLRSPAFQSVAYAATRVFLEALKLSGRQLNRTALINSLEQMQDFKTGVIPPITFAPNRRTGAIGSYVVGIDSTKKQYVPLTERLAPKEKL